VAEQALKITHVTEAPLGGVLSYIQDVTEYQLASPEVSRIDILAPQINMDRLNSLNHPKLNLHPLPNAGRSWRSVVDLAAAARKLVRSSRPDILHVHSSIAGGAVRLAAPFLPRPPAILYCPHGWAFTRTGSRSNRATALAERTLARLTDRVVCIAKQERVQAEEIGIPANKCAVIENGVKPLDIDVEAAIASRLARSGPLRILFVGRFDTQKGFDIFTKAMAELHGSAVALAVGEYIISDRPSTDVGDNIRIIGWQPREALLQHFLDADLLMMPSRWEGLPLVALEAMRAGLPVFSSRAGGLRDTVVDGDTGRLIDTENPDAFALAVRQTTRQQLRLFGMAAFARFQRQYTAKRMNDDLLALYKEVAREMSRGR
jgi:glycosyltransferase involved in cell wall biosynthesis